MMTMMMMHPSHGVLTFDPHGFENVQMAFTDAEFDEHYTGDFEVKNMIRCNVRCMFAGNSKIFEDVTVYISCIYL